MKRESINKVLEIIIKDIEKSNIDEIDKIELMLNLFKFMDNYDENIRTLRRKNEKVIKRG